MDGLFLDSATDGAVSTALRPTKRIRAHRSASLCERCENSCCSCAADRTAAFAAQSTALAVTAGIVDSAEWLIDTQPGRLVGGLCRDVIVWEDVHGRSPPSWWKTLRGCGFASVEGLCEPHIFLKRVRENCVRVGVGVARASDTTIAVCSPDERVIAVLFVYGESAVVYGLLDTKMLLHFSECGSTAENPDNEDNVESDVSQESQESQESETGSSLSLPACVSSSSAF